MPTPKREATKSDFDAHMAKRRAAQAAAAKKKAAAAAKAARIKARDNMRARRKRKTSTPNPFQVGG